MSSRRPQTMLVSAGKFRLSAAFLAMAVSCGEPDSGQENTPGVGGNNNTPVTMTPAANSPENTEGLEITAPLLSTACTINTAVTPNTMAIAVGDGESALLTLRTSDNKITLNATTVVNGGVPCELASTGTVAITASGTAILTGRTVILDYINGLFAKGTSTAPGITIDFTVTTNSTNDTLKVRGTTGIDSFAFGAGVVATGSALNINAGAVVNVSDAFADVLFKSTEKLIVNGGDGNDIITGAGTFGTTAVYPNVMRIYGGADNDALTGGSAGDFIYGGSGNDTMDGQSGNDTFYFGTVPDGTDTVNAAGTTPGSDTVTYESRTAGVTIAADGTATSGSGGENDTISNLIVNLIGSAFNDTITIASGSTVIHTVTGGAGDDTFTGGGSADVFDGQTGDDTCIGPKATMTYASRSTALAVTICDPAGDCSAGNNDGDQTASLAQDNGTEAAAIDNMGGNTTDNLVTITGLTGMTANDVGRTMKISGFDVTANDDDTTGYPISAYVSATSVTIDVTANGSFDETDLTPDATALTWAVVGAEKDNVKCANVVGGTLVDTITGDARNNIIKGGTGNDIITGGAGDDNLNGEADNDQMWGGAGSDTLIGGAGNDTLVGGDGEDILQGDAGTDTFTCDSVNTMGGGAATAPGDSDFTVDIGAGETAGTGCDTF